MKRISAFFTRYNKFVPMISTALLVLVAYAIGAYFFVGMRNPQVFFNLFRNTSYLLISAVGTTLVLLSGGIDLSVSGVVALTTVSSAVLLREGLNPWLVIVLMLLMGISLGATMGFFIVKLKVQPFIATLAGMWFGRGMCFFISDNAVQIDNPTFQIIGQTKLLIPGLMELSVSQGKPAPYITIPVVVAFLLLIVVVFISQYTRFGRTVYSIGGNEGRNEQSARLMGLPVDRTKFLVYTFNGFCSALAGLAFCLFVESGHGLYAPGFEMDVIASVVMGGTLLTGGYGYVFGTLFGVMVFAVTQALIQFTGSLSSWWTKIVIGALTLIFIGVQTMLANRRVRRQGEGVAASASRRRTQRRLIWGAAAALVVAVIAGIVFVNSRSSGLAQSTESAACAVASFRQEEANSLIQGGAMMAYQRVAGPDCVNEMYAIYPDGRITGANETNSVEKQVTAAEVDAMLVAITKDHGWFTNEIYDTYLTPCRQCYAHYILISYDGQQKGATGTDGTTAMPPGYAFALAEIRPLMPVIAPVP